MSKINVVTCMSPNNKISYYNTVENYMIDSHVGFYERCNIKTIDENIFRQNRKEYLNSKIYYK